MLVTSLCWWLYDGDWFQMFVAESLCWRLFSLCWWFSQCIKSVTNISNLSPTHLVSDIRHQHRCNHPGFIICHQNILSPTSSVIILKLNLESLWCTHVICSFTLISLQLTSNRIHHLKLPIWNSGSENLNCTSVYYSNIKWIEIILVMWPVLSLYYLLSHYYNL